MKQVVCTHMHNVCVCLAQYALASPCPLRRLGDNVYIKTACLLCRYMRFRSPIEMLKDGATLFFAQLEEIRLLVHMGRVHLV